MTLRPEAIRSRLARLREILGALQELTRVPRDEFVSSFRHHWAAERGLHLAAEVIFDIGHHILAGQFNDHPTDYEDVLTRLENHGVLSSELRSRLRGLGGFRNLLVHAYLDIDLDRIYQTLQEELDTFTAFNREIEAFLAS